MSSSKLSVGIVGLPNAGKSTLFNSLSGRSLAETAPRAFTTIDPHEAVVSIPDIDLEKLSRLIQPDQTVPASVKFIDIAGLIKGAHKGEGLGNQFLGKIREVNAIVHVVRAFEDENVGHSHPNHSPGSLEQVLDDIEVVNIELELGGITNKPTIYVLNFSEKDLIKEKIQDYKNKVKQKYGEEVICISAKLEEDLSGLNNKERIEYLSEMGIAKTGLEKLIDSAYKLLNLISFYTIKGGKEVHAWSLAKGLSAYDAAGVVHSDFQKGFIKAEVVDVDALLDAGGWKKAKELGKVRIEGKGYVVEDKDTIEFKVNV
jgi:small GTP-binding protein